ncbi:hypothetical protein GCM10007918_51760 [Piscinibacter gummiphilus]|nr:hypothetical protein GCM10007918_51760 [Piscinibacter gummiphilus]
MHIAVSWDITASGAQWAQIDERLRGVIQAYPWIRPLSTFYVVKIYSEADRTQILNSMTSVAKSAGATVHFLITPAMVGGQYQGYLPADNWAKINERTM